MENNKHKTKHKHGKQNINATEYKMRNNIKQNKK